MHYYNYDYALLHPFRETNKKRYFMQKSKENVPGNTQKKKKEFIFFNIMASPNPKSPSYNLNPPSMPYKIGCLKS
jgi:hypothetical protein